MSTNMFVSGFSPPYMLRVSTKTWMRDSHDLFDYETSQQVNVSHFAASCGLKLLREDANVSAIEYNNVVEKEHDHLLSVVCKRTGEYVVMPAEKVPGSMLYPQKLWLIVRTMPYHRYALQENDIIKLGRFRLRVKQLVPGPVETPDSSSAGSTNGSVGVNGTSPYAGYDRNARDEQLVKLFDGIIPEKTITFEEQCNMQCRICLAEGYLHNPMSSSDNGPNTPLHSSKETSMDTASDKDLSAQYMSNNDVIMGNQSSYTSENNDVLNQGSFDSDRLICACECKGSIKYVHVECLRKWIDSRWNLKSDEPLPSMVFIREVSCELCKTNYPCYIRQNGELIQIVKMPKMSVPFLVLENITPHAIKGVHLLSMKDMKDLKLGRGHESDVRIPDVSISRYHATIRYESGQFYLEDHDSKFGTLVAMRKPKVISHNEPLSVQVGRSVINLSIDESLPYVQNRVMTLSTSTGTMTSNTTTPNFGPAGIVSTFTGPNSLVVQPSVYRNLEVASNVPLTNNPHGSFSAGGNLMTVTASGEVVGSFIGLNSRVGANVPSNNYVSGSSNGSFSGSSNSASSHFGAQNFCGNGGPNDFLACGNTSFSGTNTYMGGSGSSAHFNTSSAGANAPSFMTLDASNTAAPRSHVEYLDNTLNSSRYLSFLQSAYSNAAASSPTNAMSNIASNTPSSMIGTAVGSSSNTPSSMIGSSNTTSLMGSGNTPTSVLSRASNNLAGSACNSAIGLNSPVNVGSTGVGVISPEVSGNVIAINAGRNNLVTTVGGSPRTPTNAVPLMASAAASSNGITDLYWNYMRNAVRSRLDSDSLDGLTNQRLNSFRVNPLPSSTSSPNNSHTASGVSASVSAASPNAASGSSVGLGQPVAGGDDLEMMLPESVFIANWNSIQPRNADLNVDTSTSGLEHRHSSQDLDKPISRL